MGGNPNRAAHRSAQPRALGLRLLAVAIAAGAGSVSHDARASCGAPPPTILWSYPADGDTAVPTNVTLWALPSVEEGEITLTLNGRVLPPPEQQFLYELGELQPATLNSVAFDFDGPFGKAHEEFSFTTGAGPGEPDPSAAPGRVKAYHRSQRELSELCGWVLNTQACWDGGQDTELVYEPSGSAKAWLMTRSLGYPATELWPAECGAPRELGSEDSNDCMTLSGIDGVGALHPGQEACVKASGCSLSAPVGERPSRSLAAGLALLALAGLRRRTPCLFRRGAR